MRLPSDIQRLAPFIAVAVLAVVGLVLVTRSVGPGGSGGTDAREVVQRAFTTDPGSGVLDLSVSATVEVPGRAPDASSYSFAGPFTDGKARGKEVTTEGDLRVIETGDGKNVSLRLVLADGRGFLGYRGRFYELTGAQARSAFGGADENEKPLLEELGFNVKDWIQEPRYAGTARVDGVGVDRVTGKLDGDRMLADIGELGGYIGELGGSGEQSPGGTAVLRDAAKEGEVNLFVGKADGIVRKVDVTARITTEVNGAPVRATMRFDVAVREVNKPQDVKPPARALPAGRADEIPASRLGSLADDIKGGGSSGSGRGSQGNRAGSGRRSGRSYVNCVQQAQSPAALDKCQALVPK